MSPVSNDGKPFKEAQDMQEIRCDDRPNKNGTSEDVFSDEETHDIHYKTLSWQVSSSVRDSLSSSHEWAMQFVSALMIAEIVSTGILTLPNAMAVVGRFSTLSSVMEDVLITVM